MVKTSCWCDVRMRIGSGLAIGNNGGRRSSCLHAGSQFAVGDYIHIMAASPYNGTHKIHSISTDDLTLEQRRIQCNYDNTVGNWFRKCSGTSTYRESSIHDWEDKVVLSFSQVAKFSISTHSPTSEQSIKMREATPTSDFVEFPGFPVLIDNYWKQASSTRKQRYPYGFQRITVGSSTQGNSIEIYT